jgi:DUF4097 and DUF4098 domain-containing protein YvlB
MPTFATPEPISATVDVIAGDVRIIAGDRTDTVAEVRPSNPDNKQDVYAAEHAKVEFAAGELVVKAQRNWKTYYSPFSDGGSIDVVIELPAGSQVHGRASLSAFRCSGQLGECDLKTALGDIILDEAGPVQLRTSGGDITANHLHDHAEISGGSGRVRIHAIDGSATVKNANGDNWIREATGDLRVNTANGNITVERSHASVIAKTANGSIRIADAARGEVSLETSIGKLEVGIREGTAAWLDINTKVGHIQNLLSNTDAPSQSDETVRVFARNTFGDIVISRALTV